MPQRKTSATLDSQVGKLSAVTGWMSDAKKRKLLDALDKHEFRGGQSEFINRAADALIAANEETLAQPLQFLTANDWNRLQALEKKK